MIKMPKTQTNKQEEPCKTKTLRSDKNKKNGFPVLRLLNFWIWSQ